MTNDKRYKGLKPMSERSPEERKRITSKAGKASAKSKALKRETKKLINEILAMTPEMPPKTKEGLARMGFDFEGADGVNKPTTEQMMLIMILKNAMSGDIQSAKFIYDYGLIPDMKADLQRQAMEIEREKIKGNDQTQNINAGIETIADLINHPQPDVDIEQIQNQVDRGDVEAVDEETDDE